MVAVPDYVSANARRGLELLEYAGAGLRPKTVREARTMASGTVTAEKVRRMAAWFARHRIDLNTDPAKDYVAGKTDRPSKGQVAWLLWGGGLGSDKEDAWRWAERTRDRLIDEGELKKAKPGQVKVGTSVQYPVPKPPEATTFANGIVVELSQSGKLTAGQESREGTPEDPAALVAVYARQGDEFVETDRQVVRNVSELRVIGSFDDRTRKEVSAKVRQTLEAKVEAHNSRFDSRAKRVTLRMLEAVYERGIGAYRTNPGSVRPTVTSAEQWAYARVNRFLQAVATGRFPRAAFDTDLLPEGHPLSSRK